ncbi:MAG: cation-translocating P-type ATPase, partial [Proteobacteria bacterium]
MPGNRQPQTISSTMEPTDQSKPATESCCCSDSCQTPATENAILNPQAEGNLQTTLRVAGMDCGEEVAAVERALKPLPDVREVRVNLMAGKVAVLHGESVTARRLIEAIGTEGLKASEDKKDADRQSEGQRERLVSVGISAAFAGLGLVLEWTDAGAPLLRVPVFAIAIIAGGWFIFPKAARAARRLSPDMNLLMTIAVTGAALIGEWSE